jgi:hypothetical protein
VDNKELEEYIKEIEKLLKGKLEAIKKNTKCLRLIFDKVNILYQSLI